MDYVAVTTAFLVYLFLMLGIGLFFCGKIRDSGEYFLGGRSVGSFVTALSAQASDMSGWLLMGLPGAVYMAGLCEGWVAIGLAAGTTLNWILIAPRLRIYTEKTDALTLSTFFAVRFREKGGLLRGLSALVILLFFTIYAASGFVAAGKLFNSIFDLDYRTAVLIGAAVIFVYTMLGGYLAVCWTDLFQGLFMLAAIVVVPILASWKLGAEGFRQMASGEGGAELLSLFPGGFSAAAAVAAVSSMVWGLGYCGQPHILTRFMSIKSIRMLPKSTLIATVWVLFSLGCAVFLGLLGRQLVPGLDKTESEKVFLLMIVQLVNPWLAGFLLAAVLAAIMSTIDSQLLVCSSALTEDFYKRVLRKRSSAREQMSVGRLCVLGITVVATALALSPFETVFQIVKFAWGGFGAAFGPVVVMSLYSRRTSWQSALCGMAAGFGTMLCWYFFGLSSYMYELLPGFVAGIVVIVLADRVFPQRDPAVLAEYDAMLDELRAARKKRI